MKKLFLMLAIAALWSINVKAENISSSKVTEVKMTVPPPPPPTPPNKPRIY
jgi:hypothetical protein